MIGAVQLGVLAACIVVLVPMALAGWHLSRNKVLFFSGALFISLAIAVHLSPYFPSLTDFLPTVSSSSLSSNLVVLENRDSCLSLLNRIKWKNNHPRNMNLSSTWKWVLSDKNVLACDFQKLGRNDAGDLLNGSWVMVAGDSQARLFVVSLLNLMLFEEEMVAIHGDLFKRHSDYHLVVDRVGLKLDFVWAPYINNLTHLAIGLNRNHSCPDVLVMGSGLWHMLHVNNATHYDASLQLLSRSVMPLLVGKSQPHLFWLGMPALINSMLNTEEKREKMTSATQFAYDIGLRSAKLLRPGGPFVLLDIQTLSENCGERCTEDGMHYDGVVYEAAVHIMLNALLIQSQQKL